MPKNKFTVALTDEETRTLLNITHKGNSSSVFLAALYIQKLTGINDRLQKRRKADTITMAAFFVVVINAKGNQ